jgi:hypothetical protein
MNEIFSVGGVFKNLVTDSWYFAADSGNIQQDPPQPQKDTICSKKKRKQKRKKEKGHGTVRWGQVREIYFSRGISHNSVPSSGLFPIGLGEMMSEYCFSLNETLAETTEQKLNTRSSKVSESPEKIQEMGMVANTVPFAPLPEKDRISLLKTATTPVGSPVLAGTSSKHTTIIYNEINKEIKEIRESREKNIGCCCKPLKVDKLNLTKLKSEIQARKNSNNTNAENYHISLENVKKNELVGILKSMIKSCELCMTNNCECFAAGISCSALACGCIRSSHEESSHQSSSDHQPTDDSKKEKEVESCGNPFGKEHFDFEKVQKYRIEVLQSYSKSIN